MMSTEEDTKGGVSSKTLPTSLKVSPGFSPRGLPTTDLRHVTSTTALSTALSPVLSPTTHSPSSVLSPPALSPSSAGKVNRLSQHYSLGSMSPSSIPSSPTSIHSSSSAIFERDIEPIPSPGSNMLSPLSPHSHQSNQSQSQGPAHTTHNHAYNPAHPPNPHHIARGHTTESLEQNVPSVLDSAAEILAHIQVAVPGANSSGGSGIGDVLIVEAPAPIHQQRTGSRDGSARDGRSSGWASPRSVGSFPSRSPSPLGQMAPGSLLLSIPPMPTTGGSPPRPTIATSLNSPPKSPQSTQSTTAQRMDSMDTPVNLTMDTPTSAYFSVKDDEDDGIEYDEPPTTKRDKAPEYPWALSAESSPTATSFSSQVHHQSATSPTSPSSRHTLSSPHSLSTLSNKRLSFISYTDLLTSTPTSTLPLSSLTTAANAGAEPPHITGVGNVIGVISSAGDHAHGGHTYHNSMASAASTASCSPPSSPYSTPTPFGFGYPATGTVISQLTDSGASASQYTVTPSAPNATMSTTNRSPSKRNSLVTGTGSRSSTHTPGTNNSNRTSAVFLDDLVGGEWQREGLGRGLDERLEVIMT